jgi:hypothetical protein
MPENADARVRAARKFLEHSHPYAVIELLDYHTDNIADRTLIELIVDALKQAAQLAPPPSIDRSMFSLYVKRHLSWLNTTDIDRQELATLEWAYLLLFCFDEEGHSPTLQQKLANEPEYFVEILSLRFTGDEPRDFTEEDQVAVHKALCLLESWRVVPGTQDDGSIDERKFREWFNRSYELLEESGLLDIGVSQIGHVLRYGPSGSEDEWPIIPIRNLIEELANEDLEEGLRVEIYNSRGMTTHGVIEGGQQERDLATKYRRFAKSAAASWPRTAALLTQIAEGYEREARYEDYDAELTEDLWQ